MVILESDNLTPGGSLKFDGKEFRLTTLNHTVNRDGTVESIRATCEPVEAVKEKEAQAAPREAELSAGAETALTSSASDVVPASTTSKASLFKEE